MPIPAGPGAGIDGYLLQFLVWGAALLLAPLVAGWVGGILVGARQALGDGPVVRQAAPLAGALALAGLTASTALAAPAARILDITGPLLILAAIAGISFPSLRTRSVAYAIAAGTVTGGLAVSLWGVPLLLGVRLPLDVGAVMWLGFLVAAPGGVLLAVVMDRGSRTVAQATHAADLMITSWFRALAESQRVGFRVASWALGIGIVITVLVLLSGGSLQSAVSWLLLGAAPMALLLAAVIIANLLAGIARRVVYSGARSLRSVDVATDRVRAMTLPLYVLAFYKRAICDTCLRWSRPLRSTYAAGERRCEMCGGVISRGHPGRVVVIVGEQSMPASTPARIFVRVVADVMASTETIDVTHVRLVARELLARDFEQLTMLLLNRKPSHGLRGVSVYPVEGREAVPTVVRNRVDEYFCWTDADPVKPEAGG
jgi:hypothetical protein